MSQLTLFVFLFSLLLYAESTNYNIVMNEKMMLSDCNSEDNEGNVLASDIADVSGLTFLLDNDFETLYISGSILVKQQFPNEPIKMEVHVDRWERSQWVPTMVSLKRDDFCKSLEDPFEPWHMFVISQIPKEQRTCPPSLGQVYTLTNVTNRMQVDNFPHLDVEGDLKVVVHFSVGNFKSCLVVYGTVTRI